MKVFRFVLVFFLRVHSCFIHVFMFWPLPEGSSDSENGNESNSSHEDFDEATLMGLIDIICIILNGNKTKLKTPQNLVYWENIKKRFNKSCSLFFRYFRVNI